MDPESMTTDDWVNCPQCYWDRKEVLVRICPLCGDKDWNGEVRRWMADAWRLDRMVENAGVII